MVQVLVLEVLVSTCLVGSLWSVYMCCCAKREFLDSQRDFCILTLCNHFSIAIVTLGEGPFSIARIPLRGLPDPKVDSVGINCGTNQPFQRHGMVDVGSLYVRNRLSSSPKPCLCGSRLEADGGRESAVVLPPRMSLRPCAWFIFGRASGAPPRIKKKA